MRKRLSILLVCFLLGILIVSGAYFLRGGGTSKSNLNVGLVTWPGHAISYLAKEKGFFNDLEVNIKIIDDTTARHDAYRAGDIEIMAVTVDGFASEAVNVGLGTFLFVNDYSQGGDAIVSREAIASAEDLRGKDVAFPIGQPPQFLLYKYLTDAGVPFQAINGRPVNDPSVAGQAFISGKVDAAATWEPFVSQAAQKADARILFSTDEAPKTILDSHVASKNTYKNKKEEVKTYARGILKALEYRKNNPEEANQIMASSLEMPLDKFNGILQGLEYTDIATNRELFAIDSDETSRVAQIFQEAGQAWTEIDIISEQVEPSAVIDKSFIQEVTEPLQEQSNP